MTQFTKIEQEIVALNAVWQLIDEMVNFEIFEELSGNQVSNLFFSSSSHARLFNILLVDFLSVPQLNSKNSQRPFGLTGPTQDSRATDHTYLLYLRQICDAPQMNNDTSALQSIVAEFSEWLEQDCTIKKVWFPSIDTEIDLAIPRITLLKICGDIGKHNFSRLQVNVKKIHKILKQHGKTIDEADGYLVLHEFYEWFHHTVFMYHSSTISEFLNELRWEIFELSLIHI